MITNNGIVELAKLFKERDNETHYSCFFGNVVSLSPLDIMIMDAIHIDELETTFNLYETDDDGNYVNLGKTVVLLPYANKQKYVAIGVLQ